MWLARAEPAEVNTALLGRLGDLRLDPQAEPPRLNGWVNPGYRPLNVMFEDLAPMPGDWSL